MTVAVEQLAGRRCSRARRDPTTSASRRSCVHPATARGRCASSAMSRSAKAAGRRRVWSTDTEPDGVLRKACGNRREAVCPPCAERYRQDAYHLIAAGLRGGKGVPETVTEHPAVFVDAHGAELRRRAHAAARAGRAAAALPAAARRAGLPARRAAVVRRDPRRGRSVPRRAAVPRVLRLRGGGDVEQHARRAVAPHDDLRAARARARGRDDAGGAQAARCASAYVKVAEYQQPRPGARARARAARSRDAGVPRRRDPAARRAASTRELLEHALRDGRRRRLRAGPGRARWRARALGDAARRPPARTGDERGEIAGYLAKYATKSTEQAGGLLHRVDRRRASTRVAGARARPQLSCAPRSCSTTIAGSTASSAGRGRRADARRRDRLEPGGARDPRCGARWAPTSSLRVRRHEGDAHIGRVVRLSDDAAGARGHHARASSSTAASACTWPTSPSIGPATRRAARRDRRDPRLAACAHAFGYRGHCLTKSRRYSTTFKALREAREALVHEQILARSRDATQRAIAAAAAESGSRAFKCVGIGHVTAADALWPRRRPRGRASSGSRPGWSARWAVVTS